MKKIINGCLNILITGGRLIGIFFTLFYWEQFQNFADRVIEVPAYCNGWTRASGTRATEKENLLNLCLQYLLHLHKRFSFWSTYKKVVRILTGHSTINVVKEFQPKCGAGIKTQIFSKNYHINSLLLLPLRNFTVHVFESLFRHQYDVRRASNDRSTTKRTYKVDVMDNPVITKHNATVQRDTDLAFIRCLYETPRLHYVYIHVQTCREVKET